MTFGPLDGVALIARERARQRATEGWTDEHDDAHVQGELARAAAVYALPPVWREGRVWGLWPWATEWWKPTAHLADEPDARIRELEKAGALIAAEIDRLIRLEERHPS